MLDLVVICHGACRGQGQLLGPSNPRLESLIGFKRRGSLCTWHPREAEKGPCASGRIQRHLDGFRRFMVHLNHNKVFTAVCEAKLRPWCNHVISFAISHASSWFMWVRVMNTKSTRDHYEIIRYIWWYRDLCEAAQTQTYNLLRFRRAIKRRKPPRWSPGAI